MDLVTTYATSLSNFPLNTQCFIFASEGNFNIAQGKPASQSGVYNVHNAGKAVDGNFTNPYVNGGCAAPQKDTQDIGGRTYWYVDLGQAYSIGRVTLYVHDDPGCSCLRKFLLLSRLEHYSKPIILQLVSSC